MSEVRANTMVLNQFEISQVEDKVTDEKVIYHYHDYYEIYTTLFGEADANIEPNLDEMVRFVAENLTKALTLDDTEKRFFLSKYHILNF